MELAKIKQRLEILWQEVERLEKESGGGSGDAYTKAETDTLLSAKADKSSTYTKTETNAEIQGAITELDVPSTSATGHVIRSIAQTDGKIAAEAEIVDTTPTLGSTKLCTSGGIYDAIQSAGGGTDLTPTDVGAKAANFPEDKMEVLQKHLPFTTTTNPPTNYSSNVWIFYGETSTTYYYINYLIYANQLDYPYYRIATINKSSRAWTQTSNTNIYHFITNANKTEVFAQNNNRLTNQNLNGLVEGIYHCTDTTNITNSPTTDAFIIEVISNTHKTTSSNIAEKQTLTTLTSTPKTYYRVSSTAQSNNWSPWYEITATPVS